MNLKFFDFEHLPKHLQRVSKPFYYVAMEMDATLAEGEEKQMGFRKLLEAKDCMVRAALG